MQANARKQHFRPRQPTRLVVWWWRCYCCCCRVAHSWKGAVLVHFSRVIDTTTLLLYLYNEWNKYLSQNNPKERMNWKRRDYLSSRLANVCCVLCYICMHESCHTMQPDWMGNEKKRARVYKLSSMPWQISLSRTSGAQTNTELIWRVRLVNGLITRARN